MKLTRRQLRSIINESIMGRLKQSFGFGDVFENCFDIGRTELKDKLKSYAGKKINTVGVSSAINTIDRRGDTGNYIVKSIESLVDSVNVTFNKSFIDGGEKYQIVYTQSSGDFANVGGVFGQTLLHLVIETEEIDENNSRVTAKFHGGDEFRIGGHGTSGPTSGGYLASGAPSVNMDKILVGAVVLLKQKFITNDMALRSGTGTALAKGASEFSRDDLFGEVGKLGFAGVVSNSRLGEFCKALSRLSNEFVQAKIEFTIDMSLKSAVHIGSGSSRSKAIDQVGLIDLKIYQAETNMRQYLS
jgi:hypothetical protein